MSIKKKLLSVLLGICILGASNLHAAPAAAAIQATYYVSPTGSDSNPGTLAQPFATIAKARDVVRTINASMTGDIYVYLRGGTYTLSQTLAFNDSDSGTNGHNVIYQNYAGETPIISGGQNITGWEIYDPGNSIYRAVAPNGFDTRQLYVNGLRATRAQGSAMLAGFSELKSQGLTSSGFGSSTGNTLYATVDLGSNQSVGVVKLYPFTGSASAGGGNPGFPVDFTIQTSTDGISFSTVKTITAQPNPNSVAQSYSFTATTARYVKIAATKLGEPQSTEAGVYRLQLAEIEVFTSGNIAAGATVTSNNSWESPPGWAASHLTDDDTQTSYTSYSSTTTSVAAYAQVDLGSAQNVSLIKLHGRPYWTLDGAVPGFPTDYTVQLSTDGINYSTIKTVTNGVNPYGYPVEIAISPTSARYIKVNVTQVGEPAYGDEGNYRFQLAEIEAFKSGNLALNKTVTSNSSVENDFLGVGKLTDGYQDSLSIGFYDANSTMNGWKNPTDIELVMQRFGWQQERCGIQSISGHYNIVKRPCWIYTPVADVISYVLQYKWVENAYELLDVDGEWYLDKTGAVDSGSTPYIYYRPRYGEDMKTSTFTVPAVETLVLGKGTLDDPIEHIQFLGLSFQYSTWIGPNSNDGYADNQAGFHLMGYVTSSQQAIKIPSAVSFYGAHNITIQGNSFMRLGGAGLNLQYGSQDNLIAANHFSDISGGGIYLGDVRDHHPADSRAIVKDNTTKNNYLTRTGVEYYDSVGIWAGYTDGTLIQHNEVYNVPYTGISVGWGYGRYDAGGTEGYVTATVSKDNTIDSNYIHHVKQELQDGGAIYTLGAQAGTTITNNYIDYDGQESLGDTGGAIYLDEGSAYIDVNNNVVGNAYKWFNIWTTNIHDNVAQFNYSDTSNYRNDGINNTVSNNTTVVGAWPVGAQTIIDNAGIESAYQTVKTLNVDVAENLAANQVASSSNTAELLGWGVSRLTDGNTFDCYTSTAYGSNANTVNVTIDLGASRTVGSVILYPRIAGGSSPNFPVDFTIQYSTDGTSFTTARTITNQSNPNDKAQEYAFAPVTAKYIKINVTKLGTPAAGESGSYRLQLAEVKVLAAGNYAWGTTVTATNSVESGAWGAAKLTDGTSSYLNANAGYSGTSYGSQNNTVYVQADLGSNQSVSKVKLYPRADGAVAVGGGSANYPVDFTIQVSTDGLNYTTAKTVTAEPNPNGIPQEYTFTAATARYVKVNVTKLGTPPTGEPTLYRLQLAEMKVY